MDIEGKTRAEVDRRLSRMKGKYGKFPLHEETVTNEPEYFEEGYKLAKEGWIGDAGAWVTDDANRVLLIRHSGEPDCWGTPGGGHVPGETLEETARREVCEETGVECSLTGVVWARQKTIVHEHDREDRIHMLTVEFEADYVSGGIDIGDEEIIDAAWFSDPPPSVHDFLEPKVEVWAGRERTDVDGAEDT